MTALGLGCFGLLIDLAWVIPNHYPSWLSAYADTLAGAAAVTLGVVVSKERRIPPAAPLSAAFFVAVALVPATQGALGLIALLAPRGSS